MSKVYQIGSADDLGTAEDHGDGIYANPKPIPADDWKAAMNNGIVAEMVGRGELIPHNKKDGCVPVENRRRGVVTIRV